MDGMMWIFSSKVCDTKRGNPFNDLTRLKRTESSAEKNKVGSRYSLRPESCVPLCCFLNICSDYLGGEVDCDHEET